MYILYYYGVYVKYFRQIFEIKKQTTQNWQLLIDNGGAPIKFSKSYGPKYREISAICRGREVASADQPLRSLFQRVRPERWNKADFPHKNW